jgi:hypothetical protein
MFTYRLFAEMYGWTPEQVRSLRRDELYWLPLVREAFQDAAEALAPKEPG